MSEKDKQLRFALIEYQKLRRLMPDMMQHNQRLKSLLKALERADMLEADEKA